eukprot:COSAG01_NODE_730_length_14022_cov_127.417511_6_plen_849_part_00
MMPEPAPEPAALFQEEENKIVQAALSDETLWRELSASRMGAAQRSHSVAGGAHSGYGEAEPFGLPTFPSLGVTVEVMSAILSDKRITAQSTTDWVCHTIIKPATVPDGWEEDVEAVSMPWGTKYQARYKCLASGEVQVEPPPGTQSLAEKLRQAGHTGVSVANVFFSHAWKFKFADVVKAMQTFVAHQRASVPPVRTPFYFWFDVAVVDEHASQSYPPTWWETAFAQAVAKIGHTCLMMTPWSAPVVISRAWCLWEIYCTLEAEQRDGCHFTLALSPAEEAALLAAIADNGVDSVLEPFAAIDCRNAEATSPDDLLKIQTAISEGPGHDRLNSAVLERLRKWVLETVGRCVCAFDGSQGARDYRALQLLVRYVELLVTQGQTDEAKKICLEGLREASGLEAEVDEDGDLTGKFNRVLRDLPAQHLSLRLDLLVWELKYWLPQCAEFDAETAIALLRDVIKGQTCLNTAHHASVLRTRMLLATYLEHEDEEKGPYYVQLLADLEKHLGPHHKERLMAMNSQAFYLMNIGEFEQARPILENAIAGQTEVLGANHPDTIATRINHCYALRYLDDLKGAWEAHKVVIAASEVHYGRYHEQTLAAKWNLALLLKEELDLYHDGIELAKVCAKDALKNARGGKIAGYAKEYLSTVQAWEHTRKKFEAGELNLQSKWSKHVESGVNKSGDGKTREYFFHGSQEPHASGRWTLHAPGEGYFDEVVAESSSRFEQLFDKARRTDALIAAGHLNLASTWGKVVSGDRYYFFCLDDPERLATTAIPVEGVCQIDTESDEEFFELNIQEAAELEGVKCRGRGEEEEDSVEQEVEEEEGEEGEEEQEKEGKEQEGAGARRD